MKKGFVQLLCSQHTPSSFDTDVEEEDDMDQDIEMEMQLLSSDKPGEESKPIARGHDELHKYLSARKKTLAQYVLTAAQLIAPVIERVRTPC